MIRSSVIIAAHNEASVLGRTLDALITPSIDGDIDVIVVCNGCTDDTAAVAKTRPGVRVAELAEASKAGALRAGDRLAVPGPRIYLDADIVLTRRAALAVFDALKSGAIAGRPRHVFDSTGASWPVRAWYRVRQDLPSISAALWGAGCYGLSETGRSRFDEFPDIVSDDLFIHSLFTAEEVTIVDTDPVVVTTPRRVGDLLRIMRRSYRTQREVVADGLALSNGQRGQMRDLWVMVRRSPSRIADIGVYTAIILWARLRAKPPKNGQWERDVSSRQSA